MIGFGSRLLSTGALMLALALPAALHAQAARTARVQVTVVDPSSAVVPDATVDLVGLEQATQASTVPQPPIDGDRSSVFRLRTTW